MYIIYNNITYGPKSNREIRYITIIKKETWLGSLPANFGSDLHGIDLV